MPAEDREHECDGQRDQDEKRVSYVFLELFLAQVKIVDAYRIGSADPDQDRQEDDERIVGGDHAVIVGCKVAGQDGQKKKWNAFSQKLHERINEGVF